LNYIFSRDFQEAKNLQ